MLLGTGGAGSAIAHAALPMGVKELRLYNVDPARSQALATELNRQYGAGRAVAAADIAGGIADATGLIHATPMGMDKMPDLPLAGKLLRPDLYVLEVVYFPIDTALLNTARQGLPHGGRRRRRRRRHGRGRLHALHRAGAQCRAHRRPLPPPAGRTPSSWIRPAKQKYRLSRFSPRAVSPPP